MIGGVDGTKRRQRLVIGRSDDLFHPGLASGERSRFSSSLRRSSSSSSWTPLRSHRVEGALVSARPRVPLRTVSRTPRARAASLGDDALADVRRLPSRSIEGRKPPLAPSRSAASSRAPRRRHGRAGSRDAHQPGHGLARGLPRYARDRKRAPSRPRPPRTPRARVRSRDVRAPGLMTVHTAGDVAAVAGGAPAAGVEAWMLGAAA